MRRMRQHCRPAKHALTQIGLTCVIRLAFLLPAPSAVALDIVVRDSAGMPLVGVMLTSSPLRAAPADTSDAGYPAPGRPSSLSPSFTVFTDASGLARLPDVAARGEVRVLARKPGFRDVQLEDLEQAGPPEFRMEHESDLLALAAALPSSHWLARLDFDGNADAQRHFLRHCTGCHQGASSFVRIERGPEQWRDVMDRMNRYGAQLADSERKPFAEYLGRRFAELRKGGMNGTSQDEPAPAASATITEWPLGDAASQLHDVLLHPNGLVYSGDNLMDRLYEIDPLGDTVTVYRLPHSADARPDGVLGNRLAGGVPKVDNVYGAHSLALSPSDGHIFITTPNQQALIEFDPLRKQFMEWRLQEGFYPQGIRFDAKDRAWFALGLSSKVGVFDRAARTFRYIDLPARGVIDQLLMWYTQWSLEGGRGGEPPRYDMKTSGVPFPYDLDIAPDGSVWVTRLNADDIARIDPASFAVEMIPAPFAGPRRIRIDEEGNPWVTAFAEGALARYRTEDKAFDVFPLPVAGETPYGLGIDARRGLVWVNGSQSDALFAFSPATKTWQRFPLPRRGTYTRDIGIDESGAVYTTNANFPARHIEGGQPALIRLSPLAAR